MAYYKSCVYKNCENYYNTALKTYNKENLTLFQFPKDSERRQRWMRLGKVRPNIPENYCYFCSDHFDKRYLCIRQRRTILVGDAVPYEYEDPVETANESEYVTTDDFSPDYYVCEMKNNVEQKQDQDIQVESTTTIDDDDIIQLIHNEIGLDDEVPQQNVSGKAVCEPKAHKRKSVNVTTLGPSSKIQILKTTILPKPSAAQFPSESKIISLTPSVVKENNGRRENVSADVINHNTEEAESVAVNNSNDISLIEEEGLGIVAAEGSDINPESLINDQHATTFIFKGEEYIQMSKDYYVKEKMEFMKKLKRMECVIESIKNQLNTL